MSIVIMKVKTRGDLRRFVKFPFKVFRGNDFWVPPMLFDEYATLRKDRNPAFEFCEAEYWLAYRDGELAGRVAGIINPKVNEKWGHGYARFGWIDFVDDAAVAKALLDTVESWARGKGMKGLQGPLGFTDLDKEGMLIEGFDELGTLPMIYNHAYYPRILESLGFVKDVDWLEFEVKTPKEIPEKVLRVNELVLKRSGLRLAVVRSPKELARKYGRQVFDIVDEAYSDLYGTVPLTKRQVEFYIRQYLGFVNLRYTKVIIDESDRAVGFGLSMPSLSRALQKARGRILPFGWIHILRALRKPRYIDLYLVAVRKEYQKRGLNALLMTEINRNGIEDGIISAESAGELESNHDVQKLWTHYESRQHKRRRAYKKDC